LATFTPLTIQKKILKKTILFTCFLFVLHNLGGQSYALETSLLGGKIWKHKKGLTYQTPTFSSGVDFSFLFVAPESKKWGAKKKYPDIGASLLYIDYGNTSVLGRAIGIIPGARFSLWEREKIDLSLNVGFGIAYISKKFDFLDNPTNNAIGSHVNNISRLKFDFNFYKNKPLSFLLGGSFTHISNGGTQSPNSGINLITFNAGLRKKISKKPNTSYQKTHTASADSSSLKKLGLSVQYQYGFTENDVIGGPKYPIHALGVTGFYQVSKVYRIHLGFEYEYNTSNYLFTLHTFQDKKTASRNARQVFAVAANEFILGNYALRIQAGIYTDYPANRGESFYIKWNSQYAFRLPDGLLIDKILLGITMKSHYAKAEYIALTMGIEI
jgi:hypothetical protein